MTRLLGAQTAKEVRQLLPWWVAVAATLLALGQLYVKGPHPNPISLHFLLTYAGGAVALGALAVGHEFSNRTLAALLAQPVDRHRLLMRKLAVLAVALLGLMAVARWQMPSELIEPGWTARVLLLPALLALSVTPWWTMVSRGPLAGAVFSGAVPIILVFGAQYVMDMTETQARLHDRNIDAPLVMWWGTLALCAVGAVMTWRSFVRLQAIDGPQAEIGVPAQLRGTDRPRLRLPQARSAFASLLRKELHLHQMTYLATGAYVAIWACIALMRTLDPEFLRGGLAPAQVICAYLVALLAGSVTIAEERQIGMADWQLLLPVGTRKQWATKAGTALALTALLAIGLPYLLASITPLPDHARAFEQGFSPMVVFLNHAERAVTVMTVCIVAMYVSSFSTSGMRAFLSALPVVAGTGFIASLLHGLVSRLLQPAFLAMLTPYRESLRVHAPFLQDVDRYLGLGILLTFSLFLLAFAGVNHRRVDRSRGRIIRQVFWLAAVMVMLFTCASLFSTLAWVALIRN